MARRRAAPGSVPRTRTTSPTSAVGATRTERVPGVAVAARRRCSAGSAPASPRRRCPGRPRRRRTRSTTAPCRARRRAERDRGEIRGMWMDRLRARGPPADGRRLARASIPCATARRAASPFDPASAGSARSRSPRGGTRQTARSVPRQALGRRSSIERTAARPTSSPICASSCAACTVVVTRSATADSRLLGARRRARRSPRPGPCAWAAAAARRRGVRGRPARRPAAAGAARAAAAAALRGLGGGRPGPRRRARLARRRAVGRRPSPSRPFALRFGLRLARPWRSSRAPWTRLRLRRLAFALAPSACRPSRVGWP